MCKYLPRMHWSCPHRLSPVCPRLCEKVQRWQIFVRYCYYLRFPKISHFQTYDLVSSEDWAFFQVSVPSYLTHLLTSYTTLTFCTSLIHCTCGWNLWHKCGRNLWSSPKVAPETYWWITYWCNFKDLPSHRKMTAQGGLHCTAQGTPDRSTAAEHHASDRPPFLVLLCHWQSRLLVSWVSTYTESSPQQCCWCSCSKECLTS